jgi:hypothetical protein
MPQARRPKPSQPSPRGDLRGFTIRDRKHLAPEMMRLGRIPSRAALAAVFALAAVPTSPAAFSSMPGVLRPPGLVVPRAGAPEVALQGAFAPAKVRHVFAAAGRALRLPVLAALAAPRGSEGDGAAGGKKRRPRGGKNRGSRKGAAGKDGKGLTGTWRLFNVEVGAHDDPGKDVVGPSSALVQAVGAKLGLGAGTGKVAAEEPGEPPGVAGAEAAALAAQLEVAVVRKSFDARSLSLSPPPPRSPYAAPTTAPTRAPSSPGPSAAAQARWDRASPTSSTSPSRRRYPHPHPHPENGRRMHRPRPVYKPRGVRRASARAFARRPDSSAPPPPPPSY